TFTNLSYTVAETMNLGFSSGSLVGTVSSNVVVAAAAANRLSLLTPPSGSAGAGVIFGQQPVVRIEDAYGNLRSSDNSTVVTAAITIDFNGAGLSGVTSSNVVVSAAGADHLTIQTQPSPSATAGIAFASQPVVRIEDQFGNVRSSDNSSVISAARAAGAGTL